MASLLNSPRSPESQASSASGAVHQQQRTLMDRVRRLFGKEVEQPMPEPKDALATLRESGEDISMYLSHSTCKMRIPKNPDQGAEVEVELSAQSHSIEIAFTPLPRTQSSVTYIVNIGVDDANRKLNELSASADYISQVCGDLYEDSERMSKEHQVQNVLRSIFGVA